MPKKPQKQIWEELLALIETGVKEKIEEAFASAEEQKFDLLKKLTPWEKVLPEITVDSLTEFFSITTISVDGSTSEGKEVIKNLKLYTQLEELTINDLRGKFPKPILTLPNLKKLFLEADKIQELPEEIKDMRSLETLSLSNFKVPNSVSELENLKEVTILKGGDITSLVHALGSCTTLKSLSLDISDCSPRNIWATLMPLNSVESLSLTSRHIRTVPKELFEFHNITELDFSKSALKELPASIGELTSLERLDLSHNQLKALPEELGKLTNLHYLNISSNKFSKTPTLEDFPFLSSLSDLELKGEEPTLFYKYMEQREDGNYRFYEISVKGNECLTSYGDYEYGVNHRTNEFASVEKALKEGEKKYQERLAKGYSEMSPGNNPVGELKQFMTEQAKPCWYPSVEHKKGALTASKFLGTPYLFEDEEWPCCSHCGEPLQLLLQLNLDDLSKKFDLDIGKGLLQLFYCVDEEEMGYEYFSESHLVRVIEPKGKGKEVAVPTKLDVGEKVITGWREAFDIPETEELESLGLARSDYGKPLTFTDRESGKVYDNLDYDIMDFLKTMVGYGDKFMGWPNWLQNRDYEKCPKCGEEMTIHIFQLDYNGHLPYMFGDAGRGHLIQCPHHKDVVAFGWSCH